MKELKKLSLIVVVLLLSATAALAAGKPNIHILATGDYGIVNIERTVCT